MATYIKPEIKENEIWCNNPDNPGDIIAPSASKFEEGFYYTEVPKHYVVNYVDNLITSYLFELNTYGISHWRSDIEYQKGTVVIHKHSDGSLHFYRSEINGNFNQDPEASPNWKEERQKLSDFQDTNFVNLQQDDIFYFDSSTNEWKNDQESRVILRSIDDGLLKSNNSFINGGEFSFLKDLKTIGVTRNDLDVYSINKNSKGLVIEDFKNTEITGTGIKSYNTQEIFTSDSKFTVPSGVTEIKVHLVGAGGSGSIAKGNNPYGIYGGGGAGKYNYKTFSVSAGEEFLIKIGEGGESFVKQVQQDPNATDTNGNSGGKSYFKHQGNVLLECSGGNGGRINSPSYPGNDAVKVSPINKKEYRDGLFIGLMDYENVKIDWIKTWVWGNTYGGEASVLSHGGSRSGFMPRYGAGGAAVVASGTPDNRKTINQGGNGVCIIEYNI
jgi:hypothetical protein